MSDGHRRHVGNLYVVDTQGARIVVVNPEGGFVRQLGGVGTGPGEFDQHNTTSMRIAMLSDGRAGVNRCTRRSKG